MSSRGCAPLSMSLVGSGEGNEEEEVPTEELFDRLKPFKDRVAGDIRQGSGDRE